jgi:hypothetical protein
MPCIVVLTPSSHLKSWYPSTTIHDVKTQKNSTSRLANDYDEVKICIIHSLLNKARNNFKMSCHFIIVTVEFVVMCLCKT